MQQAVLQHETGRRILTSHVLGIWLGSQATGYRGSTPFEVSVYGGRRAQLYTKLVHDDMRASRVSTTERRCRLSVAEWL